LCSIDLLANILEQAISNDTALGKNYNVADDEPVIIKELIDFISNKVNHKDYRTIILLNLYIGRNISTLFYKFNLAFAGNFLERLTHNWFYDTEDLDRDFSVNKVNTFISISEILNN
jgi:nucleoside-diphosphate-sugar epimerase